MPQGAETHCYQPHEEFSRNAVEVPWSVTPSLWGLPRRRVLHSLKSFSIFCSRHTPPLLYPAPTIRLLLDAKALCFMGLYHLQWLYSCAFSSTKVDKVRETKITGRKCEKEAESSMCVEHISVIHSGQDYTLEKIV